MIVIEIKNNNICELHGGNKELHKLYEAMKVRHPNAYFLRKHMPRGWDGKIEFIKPNGTFVAGLLERVGDLCDELGYKWDIMDNRPIKLKVKKVTSSESWELRDYQIEALKELVTHKVKGVRWIRGTSKLATNAGKSSVSAFIFLALNQEKTIYLMNSSELYRDAINDIPKIINQSVGYLQGSKIKWDNFMVCMAPSLKNRLKNDPEVRKKIAEYKVLVVDECDMSANKTNKEVISSLYNTVARIGLSGTVNASKLKKDQIKNLTVEGFFGKQLSEVSNKTLIEKGVSSNVMVRFVRGNEEPHDQNDIKALGGWMLAYDKYIISNKERNLKVVKRSIVHWKAGRTNQLIIAQRHKHIKKLMRLYEKAIKQGALPENTKIDWVHHDRKDRAEIVDKFKRGEIDILIGSMILKRGKNFPLMKFMINAGAGKSPENILQLLGRAFRGCEHYEDMFDEGYQFKSWSRRRAAYYKNEKLDVLNPYK